MKERLCQLVVVCRQLADGTAVSSKVCDAIEQAVSPEVSVSTYRLEKLCS